MKKTIVIALGLLITLSSCGFYTCATYAKKPVRNNVTVKEAKETRI